MPLMKTNAFLRQVVRTQGIMLCLALVALVGLELYVGDTLAARIGIPTGRQTEAMPAPNVDLGALMAAAGR